MKHDALGFWVSRLPEVEPQPPLDADVGADVAVVGGGYTGLWTAWWLKATEPGADVVVVERDLCGHGPSGRNGGFCNSMWFSLPTLRERFGDERALAVCRAAAESVAAVGRFCSEQEVDADYRHGGYMQAVAAPAHDGHWEPVARACHDLGAADAVDVLDATAARARCDSPLFRGAAYFPDAATVDPARLALGLRRRLLDAGVRIYERTEVSRVREDVASVTVETPAGSVRAGRAVLAAGARLLRFRGLRHSLTATSSHMLVTEPVPDVIDELGWRGGECITDSRAMIHYFRTTADDRIAFGWGGGPIVLGSRIGGRTEVDPGMARAVEQHMRRFFPQLEGRRVAHAWGGPIDVSPTHLPVVRTLGERVAAGYGYTGNGVGPSQMLARSLAGIALDRRDEHTALAFVDPPRSSVPPEPLRWLGGVAIRRAILRKERLEEQARRVDPVTRAVSAIPELIGIHVGR